MLYFLEGTTTNPAGGGFATILMLALFLPSAGFALGDKAVIMGKKVYEITTFRTEGGYQDSRHPGWVRFVPNVKEDLSRRDFTVNAMAYSPKTGLCDPFGGEAINPSFEEGIIISITGIQMFF